MTYEEENIEIRDRIKEIDNSIKDLRSTYSYLENRYEYRPYRQNISSKLSSLEVERANLTKKLKEPPEQRIKTNRKERVNGVLEKMVDALPDIDHVSGRVYRVNNAGCLGWWGIIAGVGTVIALIIMAIAGEL